MIFIKKQNAPPQVYIDATGKLDKYEDLKDENKIAVINLLLLEQAGLCAICERSSERFKPTIEHFLPQSIFHSLQLNYFNLYVSCGACNEPKSNYLIPPYIFDPRFDPFLDILNERKGLKPVYQLIDGHKCWITVPAANVLPKSIQAEHHSAYMLKATLDLMHQNRYEDTVNDKNSLIHLRGGVYSSIMPLF